ncbi:MAG: hypothetical protein CR979_04080 [Propionibacterium sp.]|nr:MAG: hypothetical protein CR979_04080 [Propionibacterium sp.]
MRPEIIGTRAGWITLTALLVLPLLVMAAMVGLVGAGEFTKVTAVVVNLDDPVKINGKLVPLGRELAGAITERDGDNVTWQIADSKSAADGMDSGEFAAIVTIPKEFSAAATSYRKNDANQARQATVTFRLQPPPTAKTMPTRHDKQQSASRFRIIHQSPMRYWPSKSPGWPPKPSMTP